jgi:DNA-binding MarR family transcriptional regulator
MIEKYNQSASAFAASALASELEFLMARARALGSALANSRLEPHGLNVRSYSVLSLACEPAPPTQRQLAEFLQLDPSQIVALVDALEAVGLVVRSPDPADRRSNIISATDAGRERFVAVAPATRAAEADALDALNADERETLRRLLTRVAFPPQVRPGKDVD